MFHAVPSRVRSALAATVALLLNVGPAAGQDKPPELPRRQGGVVTTEEVQVLTLDVLALDKKNRPAGTTTPFEVKGATRHVLFYVDLEQLPKKTIYESANAIRKALEHPAAGRYSLAANFGRVSSRVWDSDSPDAILAEADAMATEASSGESATSRVSSTGRESGLAAPVPSVTPSSYGDRQFLEKTLIDDLLWAQEAGGGRQNARANGVHAGRDRAADGGGPLLRGAPCGRSGARRRAAPRRRPPHEEAAPRRPRVEGPLDPSLERPLSATMRRSAPSRCSFRPGGGS